MKIKHTPLPLAALSGLSLAVSSATLHAQTAWDGGPDGTGTDYATAVNWADDVIPGDGNTNGAYIGDSTNQTVVYSTATSYTSTGTAAANSLRVGTGTAGVGSLTLSGSAGTLTFGGDAYNAAAWIGSANNNTDLSGSVTVSAGKLAITAGTDASINLGVAIAGTNTGTKSGTLLINGGTVEVGRRILMGANRDTTIGNLTISSGTLDMKRTGSDGEGDLGRIRFGTGNNTVNLDGGTVIFSGFHVTGASNLRSTIYMNGTTLKANATVADLFNGTTANANLRLKDGGLVVDTNGFNVTINDTLTQETGHSAILRKEGTGTLTITGTQATRTGTTTVNGGTLLVSGNGSLGTGATTVSGSGSILNLARNDTWGNHSGSVQALTIQAGGLVTNGTAVNRGFNTVQTLALDGGELRVTGTAKALADGDLFKFEAYGIRNSVTVTGATASSITNPGAIANAGINIGGVTNLGGGVGSDLTIDVASGAGLTVSAVLKNNYDNTSAFNPLSNGLVKTGDGTMTLSAANRYTGPTSVNAGTLALGATGSIDNTSGVSLGGGTFDVSAKVGGYTVNNLTGVGTVVGPLTVSTSLAIGDSPGTINFESLALGAASTFTYDLTGGASTADLGNISTTLTIDTTAILDLVQLGTYTVNDKFTLFGYETGNLTGAFAGLVDGGFTTDNLGGSWQINYSDTTAGLNGGTGTSFVTLTAIPEPTVALLGGLGLLALLRRRR